jgi:hypothetical protein
MTITPEQVTALIVALTGLVGALGVIIVQLRQTHKLVNGQTTAFTQTARFAALKEGELAGRDYERFLQATAAAAPPERTAPPAAAPGPSV